uniref:Uncharacterized protein n=1 Tax=Mus musculus TaxID=10090 RepID=Q6R5F6_MOUSE|nr:unknown [Mus musculus]
MVPLYWQYHSHSVLWCPDPQNEKGRCLFRSYYMPQKKHCIHSFLVFHSEICHC